MIRCISFDFDRTLAYTTPPTHQLISELLAEKGITLSPEFVMQKAIELRHNLPPNLEGRFMRYGTLNREERANFLREYYEARFDMLEISLSKGKLSELKEWLIKQIFLRQRKLLYDDVPETILNLKKRGIKLFILSGNHSEGISEMLDSGGILEHFEKLITVDQYSAQKIDNFHYLIEHSNMKPEEILHIGDEIETDGHGSMRHNINVLIIRREGQVVFDKEPADRFTVIRELKELFNYLD